MTLKNPRLATVRDISEIPTDVLDGLDRVQRAQRMTRIVLAVFLVCTMGSIVGMVVDLSVDMWAEVIPARAIVAGMTLTAATALLGGWCEERERVARQQARRLRDRWLDSRDAEQTDAEQTA